MESYSKDLTTRLSALCEVSQLLVQELRAYHRELINSHCPDPCTCSVGGIVIARHAVQPDASKERVNKLSYQFTGPWQIVKALKGASYKLEHCSTSIRKEKKHASDLSPYPMELILFQPLDGPDTWYGQIRKPITAQPFKEADINGFQPMLPYKVSAWLLTIDQASDFHWPTLLELDDDFLLFPWLSPYKPCTLDLLLSHQTTPLLQSLHSTFSIGPSSRVLTNSSLFLTISDRMMLKSGTLLELHSRSPCPGTLHASNMGAFRLNSTSAIHPNHLTMLSTNAFGFSTTPSANLSHRCLQRTQMTTPLAINFFLFKNG
jgi:hypothetical protein